MDDLATLRIQDLRAMPAGETLADRLRAALLTAYSSDQVALLQNGDLDKIDGVIAAAERRRIEEERKAAWDAATRQLRWTIEREGRRWASGTLRVIDREPGWCRSAAWLRVCKRDHRDPGWQWEVTMEDLVKDDRTRDRENIVYGPPSGDPTLDFDQYRRDVEQWFTTRGYHIERIAA